MARTNAFFGEHSPERIWRRRHNWLYLDSPPDRRCHACLATLIIHGIVDATVRRFCPTSLRPGAFCYPASASSLDGAIVIDPSSAWPPPHTHNQNPQSNFPVCHRRRGSINAAPSHSQPGGVTRNDRHLGVCVAKLTSPTFSVCRGNTYTQALYSTLSIAVIAVGISALLT